MRTMIVRKRAKGTDEGDVLSMLIAARDSESGVGLSEDELFEPTIFEYMMIHKQDRSFAQGVGGVRGNVREMVKLPG